MSQTASCATTAASSRKIETLNTVKSDATMGQQELSCCDWCIVVVSQLTEVIADIACPACHRLGALSVVKGSDCDFKRSIIDPAKTKVGDKMVEWKRTVYPLLKFLH